jgi:chromosome segregation ATPase
MTDEKVKQLAETLRKNGLASSEYEAIEKAKSILNVSTRKSDTSESSQNNSESPIDNMKNQNIPLNELMKEVNVTPEQVEAQQQEKLDDVETEVSELKKDIKEAEKSPEKKEQLKEDIARVKDNLDKIREVKAENEPQKNKEDQEEDLFKEEKKVDLTKVFGNKK